MQLYIDKNKLRRLNDQSDVQSNTNKVLRHISGKKAFKKEPCCELGYMILSRWEYADSINKFGTLKSRSVLEMYI